MEPEIFQAGVAPGSPTTKNEIKMLICYILSNLGQAMSFSQLHETLAEHRLVNYFDLVQALEELTRSGHLSAQPGEKQEGERYAITPMGGQAAAELTGSLPPAVREKGLKAAKRLLGQQQRLSEVSIQVTPRESGCTMHFSIPDGGEGLVSFSVFVPTQEECDLIRRRFLNDPLFIYRGVMALLTGDREVLGEILPQEEELF